MSKRTPPPEGPVKILRFPKILDQERHGYFKIALEAIDAKWELGDKSNELKTKGPVLATETKDDPFRNIFESILGEWILLINDPFTFVKKEISTDKEDWSLTFMYESVVYSQVFPVSNRPDEDGYYYFRFTGALAI